jgi:hypothetical protein
MCQKGAPVQDLWNTFKKELFASLDKYIPSKLIRSNTSLPWINHKIRKMFKKKARLYINKQRKQKYGKITGSSKRNAKDKSGKPNGPTSTIQ